MILPQRAQVGTRDGHTDEQAQLESGAINDEVRIMAGGEFLEQRIENDATEDLEKKSAPDDGERADEKIAERNRPRRKACRPGATGWAERDEHPHDETSKAKEDLGRERGGEGGSELVGHGAQASCNPPRAWRASCAASIPVNFPAMADSGDVNNMGAVINAVEHPVISDANAPEQIISP